MKPVTDKRAVPRYSVAVRLRSPQLPSFQAVTSDLSCRGLQIQTETPLKVGEQIDMELDLGLGFGTLAAVASVRWTSLASDSRAGLAFLGLSRRELRILSDFIESNGQELRAVVGESEEGLCETDEPAESKKQEPVGEPIDATIDSLKTAPSGLHLVLHTKQGPERWNFPQGSLEKVGALPARIAWVTVILQEDSVLEYRFADSDKNVALVLTAPADLQPVVRSD